jgi:hypothetical protein
MLARLLFLVCIAASLPAHASGMDPISLAVRSHVWDERVLGKEQPQPFDEYDVVATLGLPWEGMSWSGWDVKARLLASAGILRGADDNAFVASAIPALAIVHRDLRLAFEFGAGLALLSKHEFPAQDYGGPLQFALAFGISAPVYRQVGVGYRFMHYSDAGAYGRHTIGADFHMVELIYYFR